VAGICACGSTRRYGEGSIEIILGLALSREVRGAWMSSMNPYC
jgi:hypothetical protein